MTRSLRPRCHYEEVVYSDNKLLTSSGLSDKKNESVAENTKEVSRKSVEKLTRNITPVLLRKSDQSRKLGARKTSCSYEEVIHCSDTATSSSGGGSSKLGELESTLCRMSFWALSLQRVCEEMGDTTNRQVLNKRC